MPRLRATPGPALALAKGPHAGVSFGVAGQQIGAAVGGSVVDADDLDGVVRLAQQATEALAKMLLGVIDGNDDGNEGLCAHGDRLAFLGVSEGLLDGARRCGDGAAGFVSAGVSHGGQFSVRVGEATAAALQL